MFSASKEEKSLVKTRELQYAIKEKPIRSMKTFAWGIAMQARIKMAWIPRRGSVAFGFDTAIATEFLNVCFRLFWKRAIRGNVYKKENTSLQIKSQAYFDEH